MKALNALFEYFVDIGEYPSTSEGINSLIKPPPGLAGSKWKGPYLEKIPNDPWGNYYHYEFPGPHMPDSFDLWSNGADNKPGGNGKNTDIGNW